MAAATPMDGTSNDPYGGFAHWNVRSAATPTAISKRAPAFGGSKQSKGDAKITAPLDIDPSTTGKRSNALAQYSRVVAASGDMRNRIYDDLTLHSILFASREIVDAPGNAYDRLSKVLGVRGINAELAKHTFTADDLMEAGIDLSGRLVDREPLRHDAMGRPIAHAVRAPTWGDQIEERDDAHRDEIRDAIRKRQEKILRARAEIRDVRDDGDEGGAKRREAQLAAELEPLAAHELRLRQEVTIAVGLRGALHVLDEWRFDGVVQMSELKEAREGGLGTSHMLFNIGIRGPSLLRNGSANGVRYGYDVGAAFPWSHPTREEEAAVFDAEIKPRHDLLICLHLVPVLPIPQQGQPRLRFVYRYTSTRRMWKAASLARARNVASDAKFPDDPYSRWMARLAIEEDLEQAVNGGPDLAAMRSVVGAWRVGSVIDAKASVAPNEYGGPTERSVQVQASIDGSWVGLYELRERYGTSYDDREDGPEGDAAVSRMRMALGAEWAWSEGIDLALADRKACLVGAEAGMGRVTERIRAALLQAGLGDFNMAPGVDVNGLVAYFHERLDEIGAYLRTRLIESSGLDPTTDGPTLRVVESIGALQRLLTEWARVRLILNNEEGRFLSLVEDRHNDDFRPREQRAGLFARAEKAFLECGGGDGAVTTTAHLLQETDTTIRRFEEAIRSLIGALPPPPTGPPPPRRTVSAPELPPLQGRRPLLPEDFSEPQAAEQIPPTTMPAEWRELHAELDAYSAFNADAHKEWDEAQRLLDEAKTLARQQPPATENPESVIRHTALEKAIAWTNQTMLEATRTLNQQEGLVATYRIDTHGTPTALLPLAKLALEASRAAMQRLLESLGALQNAQGAYTEPFNSRVPVSAPPPSGSVAVAAAMRPAQSVAAAAAGSRTASSSGSLLSGSDRSEDDGLLHVQAPVGAPAKGMSVSGDSAARAASRGRRRVASPTDDDDDDSVVVMPPPPPPASHRTGSAKNPRARPSKGGSKGAEPPAPPAP